MKSIVRGKRVVNTYDVVSKSEIININGVDVEVLSSKPKIIKKNLITKENIFEFDEDIDVNRVFDQFSIIGCLNISEDECIHVLSKTTRLDLRAYVYDTDYEISNEDDEYSRDLAEHEFGILIKMYNKQLILSNERLLSYCTLHKLNIEETDADELFKLLYPDNTFSIRNGKIELNERDERVVSSCYDPNTTIKYFEKW